MRRLHAAVACFATLVSAPLAFAGPVGEENGKPGLAGSWTAGANGTAGADGVVDVYPARWSIAAGAPIELKVRASTGYDLRIMRLGWYAGAGAREVASIKGRPANPQPYPVADPIYGLAEAKWATTDTIPTAPSWASGVYVARVEQSDGKDAVTFFTIRDDPSRKQPILVVIGTHTHQAYNAWPGAARGGKSLYGFNSSPVHPSESIGTLNQAVAVSYDRPFLVGGGSADLAAYEYPLIRWLERNGWEAAYATDLDLDRDPDLAKGRRAVIFAGHEEYTSAGMFDNAIAARDAGTNFLFLTGDTWSWQVRLEGSTMIGYKESWGNDPEQRAAVKLRDAGDIAGSKPHFARVTRGWKSLEYDPDKGIDLRRPGMLLTGVMSSGVIRDASGQPMSGASYPWADLIVDLPGLWIYAGTGLRAGDKIPNVFGYEVDSTVKGTVEMDPFRPPGQMRIGTIKQVSDGTAKGAAGYYQKGLAGGKRVEVVALGAIYFSWALDDYAAIASGHASSRSAAAERMITNILRRWTGDAPVPPAEATPDAGADPAGYEPEQASAGAGAVPPRSSSLCTVSRVGGGATGGVAALSLLGALGALAARAPTVTRRGSRGRS